jgi:hypothetical protein
VTLEVLGGVAAPAATVDAPAVAPEAVEARERLEEWWPGLA